jgi:pyruvate/2-oxoglutarate/acetoin dehydrogenase E1 component
MTTVVAPTFFDAIDIAIADEMRLDDRVFCIGTAPAPAIIEEFGPNRARTTPIAESAMTGMAIGAAGSGLRPVVLWSCANFSFVAFDQVVNQAARIRYMFGGQRDFPIVFRARYLNGTRSAAQHSQTTYALYAHAGGLKIAVPSSADEASAMMKLAIRDPNPVLFFEPERLSTSTVTGGGLESALPLGKAAVKRVGSDVTIVAIGYMVTLALEAAERLAEVGIDAEVIDPRTLVPFDLETVTNSVLHTGRLIVVDESMPACSMASEIVTAVVEQPHVYRALTAAPIRICTLNVPVPFSPVLEDFVLPDSTQIFEAARSLMDG